MGQSSIAVGTRTDSYELAFAEELKARTEVLAVGRDSSGTLVQIAYAISGKDLEPVTVTRGLLYSVRVRFMAMDHTGRVVASLDTTRHFVAPEPVPDDEHLVGRVAVPVPSGRFEYRLAIQQGEEAGVVLPRDTVRVGGPTLGHPRLERPGPRKPQRQSGLAADPSRTPCSSIRCRRSSAPRRCSSTTRWKGCSQAAPTRCGSRYGSRVAAAGCSGRSSAGAARPSASSSTRGPRRCAKRRTAA